MGIPWRLGSVRRWAQRAPRWLVVLLVLAVCSASIYLAGLAQTRHTRDAIRATQLGQCARGNALRGAVLIEHSAVRRLFAILDCHATIYGGYAVPVSPARRRAFIAGLRACVMARRVDRACWELANGPMRGR